VNDAVPDSILEAISRLDQAATNRFLGSLLAAATCGTISPGETQMAVQERGCRHSAKKDLLGKTNPYLREEIREGADFVLAWTQALPISTRKRNGRSSTKRYGQSEPTRTCTSTLECSLLRWRFAIPA
jgi:hypothetical protein